MRFPSLRTAFFMLVALLVGCNSSTTSVSGDGGIHDGGNVRDGMSGDSAMDAGETFTIAGTVTGRTGKGLTLKNGSETLAVPTGGTFVFKKTVADGASYAVTVTTQPSDPTQVCTVTNGSGTAKANVKN